MDLTELQIQLRTIENQMAALQDEIEKMKPKAEDFKQEMYDKINFLAKRFPFKERLTFSKAKELKKDYINIMILNSVFEISRTFFQRYCMQHLSYNLIWV